MTYRRYGTRPKLALWMLIALADVALIVATAGVLTMLLIVAGLVTVAAVVAGSRLLAQRDTTRGETAAVPLTSRRSA